MGIYTLLYIYDKFVSIKTHTESKKMGVANSKGGRRGAYFAEWCVDVVSTASFVLSIVIKVIP